MNTPYREPTIVDKTEVECTRLREAEVTKRVRIEQLEQTRRKKHEVRGDGWVVPWLAACIAAVTLCVTFGMSYDSWLNARYPNAAQRSCQESVEIISVNDSKRICDTGGRYEATPVVDKPGQITVHCYCEPKLEPASSAAGSAAPK